MYQKFKQKIAFVFFVRNFWIHIGSETGLEALKKAVPAYLVRRDGRLHFFHPHGTTICNGIPKNYFSEFFPPSFVKPAEPERPEVPEDPKIEVRSYFFLRVCSAFFSILDTYEREIPSESATSR